jgi:hypothetical protein
MKKFKSLIILMALIASQNAIGGDEPSYVDGSKPFLSIKDVNRQAESWGTCSAAYEVMSMILQSKPAKAKQFKDLSNGASMAVAMSHVTEGLTPDITPEQFNSLWSFSKTLADSIPEIKRTMILADAEYFGEAGTDKFVKKVSATVKVCMKNLDGQQTYIDTWREIAKSGLLKIPNN